MRVPTNKRASDESDFAIAADSGELLKGDSCVGWLQTTRY
jgi:hypothetical protein